MSIEGPEHFNTRDRFFAEAYRVLKPGGVMALSDYTLGRPTQNALDHVVVRLTCHVWKVPRANVWTTPEYRERLAAHGFSHIEGTEIGESVIPGYYCEQRRKEVRSELARIRGFVGGRLGQDRSCSYLGVSEAACGVHTRASGKMKNLKSDKRKIRNRTNP